MNVNTRDLIADVLAAFELHQVTFEVLPKDGKEEASVMAWFERAFPIEPWGRIAWSQVPHSYCREWKSWSEMTQTFIELLADARLEIETSESHIFLMWSNGLRPVVRVSFSALRACGPEILDEDFDVWIFSPTRGWCIEKYHEGELCYGVSSLGGQTTDAPK